tara:strand:- start:632 stop:826 length:195 start_codon:yes stop_codon:yes gene_type:complete
MLKYIFKAQTIKDESGVGLRVVMATIFNLFVAIHTKDGEHMNLGLGIGPMEASITLHRWNRWLP